MPERVLKKAKVFLLFCHLFYYSYVRIQFAKNIFFSRFLILYLEMMERLPPERFNVNANTVC